MYVKILRQKYGNSTSEAADLVLGVVGTDGQDLQVIASRLRLHSHRVAHFAAEERLPHGGFDGDPVLDGVRPDGCHDLEAVGLIILHKQHFHNFVESETAKS